MVYDLSSRLGLGGFERYDSPINELLVLNARVIFCWLLFFVGIRKIRFDLVQSLRSTYELRRKMSK